MHQRCLKSFQNKILKKIFGFLKAKKTQKSIENLFDFSIKKRGQLRRLLHHKSYNKEHNNERLEFLGDVILSSIVSETFTIGTRTMMRRAFKKERKYC